ncbi:hypothetical protein VTK73DRAFT_7313 [Phialemonium thermophilum]|uniref:Uncharacterized protein n=1 Tax=Phialemonium thermophilum TaxID=223376 RepID=A0ABR3WF65_9PEZI
MSGHEASDSPPPRKQAAFHQAVRSNGPRHSSMTRRDGAIMTQNNRSFAPGLLSPYQAQYFSGGMHPSFAVSGFHQNLGPQMHPSTQMVPLIETFVQTNGPVSDPVMAAMTAEIQESVKQRNKKVIFTNQRTQSPSYPTEDTSSFPNTGTSHVKRKAPEQGSPAAKRSRGVDGNPKPVEIATKKANESPINGTPIVSHVNNQPDILHIISRTISDTLNVIINDIKTTKRVFGLPVFVEDGHLSQKTKMNINITHDLAFRLASRLASSQYVYPHHHASASSSSTSETTTASSHAGQKVNTTFVRKVASPRQQVYATSRRRETHKAKSGSGSGKAVCVPDVVEINGEAGMYINGGKDFVVLPGLPKSLQRKATAVENKANKTLPSSLQSPAALQAAVRDGHATKADEIATLLLQSSPNGPLTSRNKSNDVCQKPPQTPTRNQRQYSKSKEREPKASFSSTYSAGLDSTLANDSAKLERAYENLSRPSSLYRQSRFSCMEEQNGMRQSLAIGTGMPFGSLDKTRNTIESDSDLSTPLKSTSSGSTRGFGLSPPQHFYSNTGNNAHCPIIFDDLHTYNGGVPAAAPGYLPDPLGFDESECRDTLSTLTSEAGAGDMLAGDVQIGVGNQSPLPTNKELPQAAAPKASDHFSPQQCGATCNNPTTQEQDGNDVETFLEAPSAKSIDASDVHIASSTPGVDPTSKPSIAPVAGTSSAAPGEAPKPDYGIVGPNAKISFDFHDTIDEEIESGGRNDHDNQNDQNMATEKDQDPDRGHMSLDGADVPVTNESMEWTRGEETAADTPLLDKDEAAGPAKTSRVQEDAHDDDIFDEILASTDIQEFADDLVKSFSFNGAFDGFCEPASSGALNGPVSQSTGAEARNPSPKKIDRIPNTMPAKENQPLSTTFTSGGLTIPATNKDVVPAPLTTQPQINTIHQAIGRSKTTAHQPLLPQKNDAASRQGALLDGETFDLEPDRITFGTLTAIHEFLQLYQLPNPFAPGFAPNSKGDTKSRRFIKGCHDEHTATHLNVDQILWGAAVHTYNSVPPRYRFAVPDAELAAYHRSKPNFWLDETEVMLGASNDSVSPPQPKPISPHYFLRRNLATLCLDPRVFRPQRRYRDKNMLTWGEVCAMRLSDDSFAKGPGVRFPEYAGPGIDWPFREADAPHLAE